ncbi:hypothetical protein [Amycolatopsis saalfeldensis]|uniref:Secreted protein n=1 Tax=Amycolatopsis saalfeldensis TaxID=394193 RepID=A0A1H8X0S6_9PSEU|nr:hypothetical protein [Amycolatopsis saalfeldensis]SEP33494.1 hypothetical protein SAMN04489732_106136 [Amycolatopsis saalfeldensis]
MMNSVVEKRAPKRARIASVVAAFAVTSLLSAGFAAAPASAAPSSAMWLCSGTASGIVGKWGPVSKKCSYTSPASGWSGKLRVYWSVQESTNQSACVEARMGKAVHPDAWQSVSCGTKGTGTIKWPSNTASMLEVRVKANPTALAANVDYHI